jgi:hypothetical protein
MLPDFPIVGGDSAIVNATRAYEKATFTKPQQHLYEIATMVSGRVT